MNNNQDKKKSVTILQNVYYYVTFVAKLLPIPAHIGDT